MFASLLQSIAVLDKQSVCLKVTGHALLINIHETQKPAFYTYK